MGSTIKRTLVEALVITAVGLGVGLGANFVSPRGLSLTRNYFPAISPVAPAAPAATGAGTAQGSVHGTSPAGQTASEAAVARLLAKGLQPIPVDEVARLFHDPQYEQELIVFVDARDDRHYQEGHIPGAYQFDRYYPERYLAAVLPACLNAMQVVIYCSGGNCEDSEFAALALRDVGVPAERLFVYAAGMTEWTAKGLPVEVGGRKSGNLRGGTR